MSETNRVDATALADFVRATQDAEFDEGDAERIPTLLANTRATFAALAARTRFDAEPAEIVTTMRRLAATDAAAADESAGGGS